MEVKQITDSSEKRKISRLILEQLVQWFEVTETREAYIEESGDLPLWCAFDGERPVGFLCLNETGRDTMELHVMGVVPEYHRMGAGRELFSAACEYAKMQGYSFIQVKTVKMGVYEDYDRTNRFYQSLGFKEFEVFPVFWDEANPCQVYIMAI